MPKRLAAALIATACLQMSTVMAQIDPLSRIEIVDPNLRVELFETFDDTDCDMSLQPGAVFDSLICTSDVIPELLPAFGAGVDALGNVYQVHTRIDTASLEGVISEVQRINGLGRETILRIPFIGANAPGLTEFGLIPNLLMDQVNGQMFLALRFFTFSGAGISSNMSLVRVTGLPSLADVRILRPNLDPDEQGISHHAPTLGRQPASGDPAPVR